MIATGPTAGNFVAHARGIGIRTMLTPIATPQANAVAERLVGTFRRECLDHIIVINERHLRHVLREFVRHYNAARPHRTLELEAPEPKLTPAPEAGPVVGRRVLAGLMGSSTYGAQAAGILGLPYSLAHHFASEKTMAAVMTHRESFRTGGSIEEPYVMLAVSVVCAETDEHARWLAALGVLSFVRSRTGRRGRFPTPEEAAAYEYSPQEQMILDQRGSSQVVGSPAAVREQLMALVEATGADELMITTAVHAHADRVRSYELLAEAVEMESPGG